MTDDIITISAGAPPTDLTPGVYEVTLTDISEPRTIYPQTGPNAGKEVQLRDWTFALEDGTEVTGSASTSSGPKSKTYAWLTALLGGTPPAVGPELPEVPAPRPRGARDDRDRRGRLGQDREPLGPAEGAGGGPGRCRPGGGSGRGPWSRSRSPPTTSCPSSRDARSGVGRGRRDRADRAGLRRVRPAGGREGPGDGARLQERDDAPGLDPASSSRPRPPGTTGSSGRQTSPERVVAFDLDDGGGADRPWRDRMLDLVAQHGPLPATKITTTPSGGRHAFYRWPADVPIPAGDELFGFTVRWPGRGYLVGPGSRIGDREYTAGPVTEIADLPAALGRGRARRAAPRRAPRADPATSITVTGGFTLPDRIPSGRRYAAVRDYVASRYNAGLGLDELWELVRTQVAPRFEVAKTEAELRADFERVTAKIGERLGAPAHAPRQPRSTQEIEASSIDAADLLELDIPPLQWIVPDLLPEGTTVLAGPPKLGKSCLVYQIAVEVALGGELLGRAIEQGDVLYLALEDGKRRGQTRLRAALGDRSMPRGRLEVRWSAAKLGEGLEQRARRLARPAPRRPPGRDRHAAARPRPRRRPAQRVRGRRRGPRPAAGPLQGPGRSGCSSSTTARRTPATTSWRRVSGTYGITGSADTTLVIQRKRLETFGKLVVTGRDVAEVEEPVQFNGMTWSPAPRSLAEASFEQAEVYKVIEAEGPIFPKAIADLIGSTREAVQRLVEKLVAGGSVARARGGYVVASVRIAEEAEEADAAETSVWTSSAHSPSRARPRV